MVLGIIVVGPGTACCVVVIVVVVGPGTVIETVVVAPVVVMGSVKVVLATVVMTDRVFM